ncbi:FUSC family protein [Methylobacterium sp. Leaf466]|uniref:FUSC family protein n=1 Tax=Methylobacterium sp. Leaf466 TaxID=1736386 RepID=UPI0006FD48D3|nr:FUSC family protein [Methylobacterium sp. Leaf466]KQT86616.1 fusaric acid resistance protein [Methylobacterium sp. Leaf466]
MSDRAAVSRLDRALDRIEALVPAPAAWAFALRIWLAMVLALGMAFWLQLASASSAMVCVAILAQPKRGQARAKATYRFLGTLVGAVVGLALIGLFAQDRVLLLVSFTAWLSLCVYVGQFLQDTRSYGAMLSGYTVAIVAIAHIDAPQATFEAAVDRVAAIAVGILVVTLVNDALGAPGIWRGLRRSLADAHAEARAFAREALTRADPGPERTAALIRRVAALRGDAVAVREEFRDGDHRSAGARSTIAALYAMTAAARALAEAARRCPDQGPRPREALGLCRGLLAPDSREDSTLVAADLHALVEAGVAEGDDLGTILVLQRALDVAEAVVHAEDGLASLEAGRRPLRTVSLPTHRDAPVALRGAARVALAFGLTALFFVATGWPGTTFALVQVAAMGALSTTAPNPKAFARGVLIGMPLASACAGFVLFGMLSGVQGFPLLAIAIAPVVAVACFLCLNPATFSVGFILLVFFPVLLSPSNPQGYDPQGFLGNAFLVVVAAVILSVAVRVILPLTPARHRAFALDSARRSLLDALAGDGGDATTRTSLNSDRLLQFAQWTSGSGAVRAMAMAHAFALSRLEAAAARAHGQFRVLDRIPALETPVASGRRAFAALDGPAMERAGRALVEAGRGGDAATRGCIARAAGDLATAAALVHDHGRFLRRLGLPARTDARRADVP